MFCSFSVLVGKLRDTASNLATAASFAPFPIHSSLHRPSHNINYSAAFRKIPRLRPFVLLVKATCRWRWVRKIGGMILTRENRSTWRSNHSNAPLPITNLRRTDPWLKPGLRGEKPTINRIGQGTALKTKISLNYTLRFSSYRKANNSISVKKIPEVIVVQGDNHCLLWGPW
jgi:hypothetical protein